MLPLLLPMLLLAPEDTDARHAPSSPAVAEDPQAQGDVVVNGQRVKDAQAAPDARVGILGDRDLFDTPFSIAGYTDQLIRDQQARSVSDVLANDASVRAAGSRYADTEYYTIRGFQAFTVLFNGLPGLADSREPFLDGVARVEVFKGPSTLVNGSSQEVGGTINFVPKRASDGGDREVTLGYIGDAQAEEHVDLGGRWGAAKAWGLRGGVGLRYGDTPLDHQRDRAAVGTLAFDHRGDRFRFSVDASVQDRRLLANLSGFTVLPGFAVPRAPDLDRNIFDRSSYYRKKNEIGVASAEYDLLKGVTLFADYGHQHSHERYRGPYSPTITAADGTTDVLVIPYVLTDNSNVGRVGARATFATGPVKHEVTVSGERYVDRYFGGYAIRDTLTTNIYAPRPLAPDVPDYGDPDLAYRQRNLTQSAVIADAASVLDGRVTLIAGARRVTIGDRARDPLSYAVTYDYRASKTTPAVALLVKPVRRLTLYGNYIQALQEGPTAPVGTVNANQVFPPNVAKQYEVGAKYEAGPAAGVTLAAYRISQASGLTDPVTNRFSVNGEQVNRGLELTAFGELVRHVRLLGGASLIDAKQARTADGDSDGRGDLDGKKAVGVPRWQVNAGGEWDAAPRVTLTGRVLYTAKEYVDADDARTIPGWTRFDLGARYAATVAGKPLVFRASVENVTDHDFWSSALGGRLALGAPRTALLSVTRDF